VFRVKTIRLTVIAVLGGVLALFILRGIGVKSVLSAVTAIGWRGFSVLLVYQLGQFVVLGAAWYVLMPASSRASFPTLVWARMVRDATSELLPFSHLGGIVLGARAATARGFPQSLAYGSIVTDITTELLAQIAFTAGGVGILMSFAPHNLMDLSLTSTAILGLMTVVVSFAGFAAFQRYGRAFTTKLVSRLLPNAVPFTESVALCIREIYRKPDRVVLSVLLHCAGWLASALSTWIALLLMGVRVAIWPIIAIESLVCAVRSVAFWMPNGLGVQELAYAAIAPVFGVGAEMGLAVSLLKRARDIAIGVPTLLLWHFAEGRRFLIDRGSTHEQTR
jgi:glycosyltransferase 2 family protein